MTIRAGSAHSHHQRIVAQRTYLSGRNVQDVASGEAGGAGIRESALRSTFSTSRGPRRNSASRSIPASRACRPRWRSVIGPAVAIPTIRSGQTDDWMNEIYPLWVAAHGIMIITPVNWYHAPGA